jgi:hypothetical protein
MFLLRLNNPYGDKISAYLGATVIAKGNSTRCRGECQPCGSGVLPLDSRRRRYYKLTLYSGQGV